MNSQPGPPLVFSQSAGVPAPVEYAVAVDRYLAGAALGRASRRVYRISLTSWAWPLVGRPVPAGTDRRGARPPVLPLALLDDAEAGPRLAAALAARERSADPRTVSRELSALRSAAGWWQDQGWISADPTAGLRTASDFAPLPALTDQQLCALFRLPASLREQAFWHLLRDTSVPAQVLLGLDAPAVDLIARRVRPVSAAQLVSYGAETARLLGWLLAGRAYGPVFLTDRRASSAAADTDVCPLTRRTRMSYRRAAEIFTGWTRQLDPAGRGWTLHQLRQPARSSDASSAPFYLL